MRRWNRRALLGLLAAGPWLRTAGLSAQADVHRVRIVLSYATGRWYYDPVGLFIEKGQTVEWLSTRWGPTVSAFHPSIDNQELRIPENAEPFDSGLLSQGDTFRWTFLDEGTYDYFSRNHLGMGVIGRVVVGKPGGPGERPPRYGGAEGRAPIYPRAMQVFSVLDSSKIVRSRELRFPSDQIGSQFPSY